MGTQTHRYSKAASPMNITTLEVLEAILDALRISGFAEEVKREGDQVLARVRARGPLGTVFEDQYRFSINQESPRKVLVVGYGIKSKMAITITLPTGSGLADVINVDGVLTGSTNVASSKLLKSMVEGIGNYLRTEARIELAPTKAIEVRQVTEEAEATAREELKESAGEIKPLAVPKVDEGKIAEKSRSLSDIVFMSSIILKSKLIEQRVADKAMGVNEIIALIPKASECRNLVLIIRDQGGKSELTTVINHGGSVVAAYAKTLGNEYYGVEALKAFSASTGSIIRLWCSSEEL
ncbi:MAG: hypothetical protein QW398_06435 [Desulfurococcaceae archaeon]